MRTMFRFWAKPEAKSLGTKTQLSTTGKYDYLYFSVPKETGPVTVLTWTEGNLKSISWGSDRL